VPEVIYRGPDDLALVPNSTGCYIFKTSPENDSRVLYVGKANNLRSRVRQYFIEGADNRALVQFIRQKTGVIEFILVPTEQDALVLENELIKKHKPLYNISLRDDKRYLSLRLDLQHEWPKIDVVRRIKKDGAVYMGPFSSGMKLRETLNLLQQVIPLRSCLDSKLYNRSRPCIEYDIKRCVAPCVGYVTKEDYQRLVDQAVSFLRGEDDTVVSAVQSQMDAAAEAERYEEAAVLRDRLKAMTYVTQQKQQVISHAQFQKRFDCDAVGFARDEERFVAVILFIRNGVLLDQRTFEIKHRGLDREELESQFLERYYSGDVYIPNEILVSQPILEVPGNVNVLVPRLEDKNQFLESAHKNAEAQLKSMRDRKEKVSSVLAMLKSRLGLSRIPETMDCIDISHHGGEDVVASVVRFRDGAPEKDFYRKIKLHAQQVDDFESIREAVDRRYHEVSDLPSLIVIDGGRGQLSAAEEILKAKNFLDKVDLVSLAKARALDQPVDPFNPHNRERIFKLSQKNPVLLEKESAEELLLIFLRDEAHRFAITFHRKKKLEQLSASILDQIPGISAKQKIRLLKEFGSVAAIQKANDFDLLKIVKPKVLEKLRFILPESSDEEE